MKYIFNIHNKNRMLFVLLCCFYYAIGYSQESIVSNSDLNNIQESVNSNSTNLKDIALLELQGDFKGLKLPRMTTVQRDAIKVDAASISEKEGLIIYNTTTECINYYNNSTKSWVSLCGEEKPANLTILDNQCSNIKVLGAFYKDIELSEGNGILIEVNVSTPGSYEISGASDTGYNFAAKGKFFATGTYTIFLKGEGKPIKSYKRDQAGNQTEKGDKITLSINNVKSSCEVYVFVDQAPPSFEIVSTITKGVYLYKTEVDDSNYIEANVNVLKPGKYIMYTNTTEGVLFKAEGVFSKAGANQKVILKADGIVESVGKIPVRIYTNSKFEFGQKQTVYYDGAFYQVESGAYDIVCDEVEVREFFQYNKPLGKEQHIDVLVNIKKPGLVNIKFYNEDEYANTILFETGIIKLEYDKDVNNNDVIQKWVTLKSVSGVPRNKKEIKLKAAGGGYEPLAGIPCDIVVPVSMGPAKFSIKGTPVLRGKYYSSTNKVYYVTPSTNMGTYGNKDFRIEGVVVNLQSPGVVKIKTPIINGVYFMYEGVINDINKDVSVSLKAYGESLKDGYASDFDYRFIYYSDDVENNWLVNNNNVTIGVDYIYSPKKILSIGDVSWHPAGDQSHAFWNYGTGPDLAHDSSNFGVKGEVRIDDIEFIKEDPGILDVINYNKLEAYLQKVDGVFIGGSIYEKGFFALERIADEINKRGLAVVYAESNNGPVGIVNEAGIGKASRTHNIENQMFRLLTTFTPDTDLELTPILGNYETGNRVTSSISSPVLEVILSNRFLNKNSKVLNGKSTLTGSLLGGVKFINLGDKNIFTSSHLKKLPTNFISIANFNSDFDAKGQDIIDPKNQIDTNTNVWAMIHKDKGLLVVFDAYFGTGPRTGFWDGLVVNIYPMRIDKKGKPEAVLFEKKKRKYPIYNNYFYLNSIYWLIDYSQKNRKL